MKPSRARNEAAQVGEHMTTKLEDEAVRQGITSAELESRIDAAQAAIQRGTALLDFPPGYVLGEYKLRMPKRGAMKADALDDRPLWIKPGKGRPAVLSPLLAAVARDEARRLAQIGENRRKPAARKASATAATIRAVKSQATNEAVKRLSADRIPPHVIAKRVGITPRRVRQILRTLCKNAI